MNSEIARAAPGYGMASVRVDGNDVLGTYAAVRAARALCVEHSRPVLIEAMTYRVGHHSTSDDSSVYRCVTCASSRIRLSVHSLLLISCDFAFCLDRCHVALLECRKRDEVKHWTSEDNPVSRLRLFLESRSLWDEAREKQMDAEIRKGLLEAFQVCNQIQYNFEMIWFCIANRVNSRCFLDGASIECLPYDLWFLAGSVTDKYSTLGYFMYIILHVCIY